MKLTKENIGDNFTQSHWTTCYFKLIDVGCSTVWGVILDRTNDNIVVLNQLYDFSMDWEPFVPKWEPTKQFITKL